MQQTIIHTALVVRDYDEAIAFFCQKLHFTLVEDSYQPEQDKRWVVVAPPGSKGTSLLLARATNPEQAATIGKQTGGRVFLFLRTDDFWRDYQEMLAAGIKFARTPKIEPYGTVAVFEDLYGNLWDLIGPATPKPEMPNHPLEAWHRLVSTQDPSGLNALLAEDAVFYSPVVHKPQRGKKLVHGYLTAAFKVFFNPSFRYLREIVGPSDAMMEFETEIDGVLVNGVDVIKWNDAGEIVEFKVMIRPLKAINIIHQRMAAMLQSNP